MREKPLLSKEDFKNVIQNAPLISFDFIIKNTKGEVLLGYRKNGPAKDYWFVPGGRIRKNELFDAAFLRLLEGELGISKTQLLSKELAKFINPTGTLFIHHYPNDNTFGIDGIDTHYIVFPFVIKLAENISIKRDEQHSQFKWYPIVELLRVSNVHPNTKAYFENELTCPTIIVGAS